MSEEQSAVSEWLERVGRFSARNPREVVVVAFVLLLVAGGVALATVQLNMGMMLYIDEDSETAREWTELESTYERGNAVFVVVESEDVTDPETVRLVDRLDEKYTDLEGISAVNSLADVVRLGAGGEIPDTEAGIERAIDRVENQNDASGTLVETVSPSDGTTVLVLSYGEVAPPPDEGGMLDVVATKDTDVIERMVTSATDEVSVPADTSVTITGASMFENAAFELMLFDVLKLFAGGFLLVFVVVYVIMRRRLDTNWHVFLSLVTALVALVVMLAAMGVLGYDFNAIMLSVLPVGLGLGVDYGLQVQTRYAEERDAGRRPTDAAGIAASTTGRTLLLAMGTTVVGFGSLFVSPIPPVRQFGVTAGISVFVSMALSVTLLVALLVQFDRRADTQETDDPATDEERPGRGAAGGYLESAATAVAGAADARPVVILLVLLPAVAGGALAYPHVDTTQQMLDYWPQDLEERAEFESVTETIASPKTIYVVVERDDPYAPQSMGEVAAFQDRVTGLEHVDAVGGPVTTVRTATGGTVPDSSDRIRTIVERGAENPLTGVPPPSEHPDQLLLTVRVANVEGEAVRTLIDRIDSAASAELSEGDVAITGKPVVNRVIIENGTSGQVRMTALSFGVALLFLVFALRSFRDSVVLVASVPATAAILMVGAMFVFDIPWNPGTVSMASIALGVGVDYGLHVYERYEELSRTTDLDAPAAMESALRKLSRPVFGSGLTTMAGFGVLVFSEFPVVSNFGKALVLVIALSLLATFVTLPAAMLVDVPRPFQSGSGRQTVRPDPDPETARAIAVSGVTDGEADGFLWGTRLESFLADAEAVLAVVASTEQGIRHEHRDQDIVVSPGQDCQSVLAVTDERLLLVVGRDGEGHWEKTVDYSSVRSVETSRGIRRSRLTVVTRDGDTYHVRVSGREALDGVADVARRTAKHWVRTDRWIEDARSRLLRVEDALARDDPDAAATAYQEAREYLAEAREIADAYSDGDHGIRRRVTGLETRLARTRLDGHRMRAENLRAAAEAHREAGRYERAHEAYTSALEQYDRALAVAGNHDDLEGDLLQKERTTVETERTALESEPLERAAAAADRARSAEDRETAVDEWAEALERYRSVLELVWGGDDRFDGDPERLRTRVEAVARGLREAHRDYARDAEERADDLDTDAAERRQDLYETALAQFRAARDIAAEFRSGDPAAFEPSIERLESKLAGEGEGDTEDPDEDERAATEGRMNRAANPPREDDRRREVEWDRSEWDLPDVDPPPGWGPRVD